MVAVRGELDLGTAPALEPPLKAALEAGESVIIDLTECEFIDSTGIALVVRAWQQTEEAGRKLLICSQNEQVQRVLEISGLNASIPVRTSREQGLAALQGAAADRSA